MIWHVFFFSSRRRHTRSLCDWSSDVCSSDLWQILNDPFNLPGHFPDSNFLIGLGLAAYRLAVSWKPLDILQYGYIVPIRRTHKHWDYCSFFVLVSLQCCFHNCIGTVVIIEEIRTDEYEKNACT